jgi:predicted aldo/keto reductase-like oxidoreductase
MTTMEQVEENLRILSNASAGSLTEDELKLINKASAAYNELIKYGCTACGYCLPECPKKIDIPGIVEMHNEEVLYDCLPDIQFKMQNFTDPKASACIACGDCEKICPQHLPIPEIMKESATRYE